MKRQVRILIVIAGEAIDALKGRGLDYPTLFTRALKAAESDALQVEAQVFDLREVPEDFAAWPLEDIDGVVMTGSAAMVDDDAPWMRAGARLLRTLVDEGVPFFGVCFGHQLLAHALGGQVGPNPDGYAAGSSEVTVSDQQGPFASTPTRFHTQVVHRDVVLDPGPTLTVIGTAAHDANHVLAAGGTAFSVQFHPELDRELSALYLEARAARVTEDHGEDAVVQLRKGLAESPHAASLLGSFARWVAERSA